MKGLPANTREIENSAHKVAEKIEAEQPDYSPIEVVAAVKERLSGYPADVIENALVPEHRAKIRERFPQPVTA